jgi:hypothetical protein
VKQRRTADLIANWLTFSTTLTLHPGDSGSAIPAVRDVQHHADAEIPRKSSRSGCGRDRGHGTPRRGGGFHPFPPGPQQNSTLTEISDGAGDLSYGAAKPVNRGGENWSRPGV